MFYIRVSDVSIDVKEEEELELFIFISMPYLKRFVASVHGDIKSITFHETAVRFYCSGWYSKPNCAITRML